MARVAGESTGNVLLRRAQYRMADDPAACCMIARSMIFGKVYNARRNIERVRRDHALRVDEGSLAAASLQLKELLPQIAAETVPDSLRGLEGAAATICFGAFDLLILGEIPHNKDVTHNANLFIKTPIDKKLLSATIDSALKTRQSLLKMARSNQELARSLYQLNVLYNTSSQLAGSLDKDKLIKIMIEGIEKSLNFDLSCTLMFRSEREPVLIINSVNKISDRLLEALKLRAILSYKSILSDPPYDIKIGNLKIEKNIKHNIDEYDFSVLRYDNMFSPIMLNDEFFGFTEIYREKPFTTEDATCFQTLVQQVTIPLQSASFTQELKATNRK